MSGQEDECCMTCGALVNRDWRPIETAPKDGTPLLIWDGDSYLVAIFCGCKRRWLMVECKNNTAHEESPIECEPTHWMPLPEPPTALKTAKSDP